MSWKPEVIADNSGKWAGNALRFATKAESDRYVDDLMMRWTSVRDTRSIETPDDPVTARIVDNKLEHLHPFALVVDTSLNPPQKVHQCGCLKEAEDWIGAHQDKAKVLSGAFSIDWPCYPPGEMVQQ